MAAVMHRRGSAQRLAARTVVRQRGRRSPWVSCGCAPGAGQAEKLVACGAVAVAGADLGSVRALAGWAGCWPGSLVDGRPAGAGRAAEAGLAWCAAAGWVTRTKNDPSAVSSALLGGAAPGTRGSGRELAVAISVRFRVQRGTS